MFTFISAAVGLEKCAQAQMVQGKENNATEFLITRDVSCCGVNGLWERRPTCK